MKYSTDDRSQSMPVRTTDCRLRLLLNHGCMYVCSSHDLAEIASIRHLDNEIRVVVVLVRVLNFQQVFGRLEPFHHVCIILKDNEETTLRIELQQRSQGSSIEREKGLESEPACSFAATVRDRPESYVRCWRSVSSESLFAPSGLLHDQGHGLRMLFLARCGRNSQRVACRLPALFRTTAAEQG